VAMQEAEELGVVLHHSSFPQVAVAGIGNSCPARLFMPFWQAFVQHFKPISTFQPTSFESIGLTRARMKAWQANMRRGHKDHVMMRRNGDIDVGQEVVNVKPRHKRTMCTSMSVVTDALPDEAKDVVWFTAEAIKLNDPSKIRPIQEWREFQSSFNTQAVEMLAVGFPDKAVVSDLLHGAQPQNDEHSGQAFLGPNHATGEREFRLVDKAFEADIMAGRAVRFAPECCPYVWPCFAHPTGAVPKHLRSGEVDKDSCRPTSDLSWPCTGTDWYGTILAVNDSIDLERSFPRCKYFSWEQFCLRLSCMKASGLRVV